MSNRFDAAIRFLWTYKATLSKKYWKQIESAIRVLEAAGKVDKKEILAHITGPYHEEVRSEFGDLIAGGWLLVDGSDIHGQIRALLESLPDPATDRVKDESIKDEKEKA